MKNYVREFNLLSRRRRCVYEEERETVGRKEESIQFHFSNVNSHYIVLLI